MTEKRLNQNIKYLWGLSLRESVGVTLFGVLIAVSKEIIKIPMSIPGHAGLLWMAVLSICCLTYRNGRSGVLSGLISGLIIALVFPSREGILDFFKYFVPGVTMDLIFLIIPKLRERWYFVGLVSALCHVTKLIVNFIDGIILHLPMGFLALGIKAAIINHIVFGFLGGLLGFLIFTKFIGKLRPEHLR